MNQLVKYEGPKVLEGEILSPSDEIPVHVAHKPFGHEVKKYYVRAGCTIDEIVWECSRYEATWHYGVVKVCDEYTETVVPRELWKSCRPKPNTFVTISLRLQGGGKGIKSVLAVVAAIALMLTTAFISTGGLALLGMGEAFAAGTWGATLSAAAVGVAGSLLLSSLFPPPKNALDKNNTGESLPNADITGNTLQKGGTMQRVIGTRRVPPVIVSPPLIEVIGPDEWFEVIFGLAGPHKLEDIKIGETAISEMSDIEVQTLEGWDDEDRITIVNRQSYTEAVQLTASMFDVKATNYVDLTNQNNPWASSPQWHTMTTRRAPDEFWITCSWNEGMYNSNDTTVKYRVPLRLRIRQIGTSDWINLPELHIISKKPEPIRKLIKLIWAPQVLPAPSMPVDGPNRTYYTVPTATSSDYLDTTGWQAHSSFAPLSGSSPAADAGAVNVYDDRFEIFLNHEDFPKSGRWEIQIKQGTMISDTTFNNSTYAMVSGGSIPDFFYPRSDGAWVVDNQENLHYKLSISRVSSIWNEPPVVGTGFALIALKGKNRSINNLSVVASGYVKDWDGSEWGEWKITSNPAAHYRDILVGNNTRQPISDALVDSDNLVEWRQFCIDNNLECNIILQGNTTFDALQVVASSGNAVPRQADKWGVVWEYDRSAEAPVQIFTPRNSKNLSVRKAFTRFPDAFIVSYTDKEDNYNTRETIVYRDGVDASTASVFENVSYDFADTEASAIARARLDLRQMYYRDAFFTLETDIEGLICTKGCLVGLQYDTIEYWGGSARIVSVQTSEGNVTGITLDGSVPVAGGDDIYASTDIYSEPNIYAMGLKSGVAIRLNDGLGTVIVKELSNTPDEDATVLTFATPFTIPAGLETGCLVSSGLLGQEYARKIVFSIDPDNELTATLTLVDEAQEIHA